MFLNLKNKINAANQFDKTFCRSTFFFICFCVYFVALIPLVRADFNYIDDNGRVIWGYRGWDNFSRFMSNFLSQFVHINTVLADISPLTQILAILLLTAAGIILIHLIVDTKRISLWCVGPVLLLGLCPYFLECFSYKFDSVYMSLSVLAGIAPFAFARHRGYFCAASFLGTLLVCTTYQVSIACYLITFIFLLTIRWNEGLSYRELCGDFIAGGFGFIAGLLCFKFFIMIPVDMYVSSQTGNLSDIRTNLTWFFKTIKSDFRTSWLKIIYVLFACYIYTFVKNSQRNKILAFIIAVFSVIGFLICSFGLYSILKAPLHACRAMYGIATCLAVCGIYIGVSVGNLPSKLVVTILAWVFLVFTCIYGNTLSAQKQYTEFRTFLLINDLNHINEFVLSSEQKSLTVHGNIGRSPIIKNDIQTFPVLERLLPSTLGDSAWMWNVCALLSHYGLKNIAGINTPGEGTEIIVDTMYHRITRTGNHFFVLLK